MVRFPRWLMLLAVPTLLPGCAVLGARSEITQRYHSARNDVIKCDTDAGSDAHCYQVSVSALPADRSSGALRIEQLSEAGQAAYIQAMAERASDPAELRTALAAPIAQSAGAPSTFSDSSAPRLRFVLGLFPTAGWPAPGDRLAWAKVTITPLGPAGSRARFMSWTQTENAFQRIDVGSVITTRADQVTAETGLDVAKALTGAKVGVESKVTLEEKADIEDVVGIAAAIRNGVATIVQYGGWRQDLIGNATFDATVEVPPQDTQLRTFTTHSDLRSKRGPDPATAWTAPAELMLGRRFVRTSRPAPLCARVAIDFVVRHVTKGERTFSEANDRVQFLRGATSSIQEVASPIIPETWNIAAPGQTPAGEPAPRLLQFRGSDGDDQVLAFTDKGEALAFLQWLRATKTDGRIGNGTLLLKEGQRLDLSRHSGLDAVYFKAKDDWNAADAGCVSQPK